MASAAESSKKRKRSHPSAKSVVPAAPRTAFEIAKARKLQTLQQASAGHAEASEDSGSSSEDEAPSAVQLASEQQAASRKKRPAIQPPVVAALPRLAPVEDVESRSLDSDDGIETSDGQSAIEDLEDTSLLPLPSIAAPERLVYSEHIISRQTPLRLHHPCRLMVKEGVVRILGAQFDRNSEPVPVFAMGTHYQFLVEANDEALVSVDYRDIDDNPDVQPMLEYFSKYRLHHAGPHLNATLRIPRSWTLLRQEYLEAKMPRDSRARTIHVCGRSSKPRGLFAKFIVNSLFCRPPTVPPRQWTSEVYVLDLDAESPEFTSSGQISLIKVKRPVIGPSYMNAAAGRMAFEVLRTHAIAPAGHKSYPEDFLAMAHDLRSHIDAVYYECHMRNAAKPIVIVRHGHYNEPLFSTESLAIIEGQGQQSLIYVVDQVGAHNAEIISRLSSDGHEIIPVSMYYNEDAQDKMCDTSLSSKSVRSLQQMADFYIDHDSVTGTGIWNDTPLFRRPACELSYGRVKRDFAAVLTQFGQRPAKHANWLSQLLNGMFVSIVVLGSDAQLEGRNTEYSGGDEIPYFADGNEYGPRPFDPAHSQLVGVGLIRGIDQHRGVIELITSDGVLSALEKISVNRIVLAIGCAEAAGWPQAEYLAWQSSGQDSTDEHGTKRYDPVSFTGPVPWTTKIPTLSARTTSAAEVEA